MAFYKIKGNALDFEVLMSCINTSAGSRGQNRLKLKVRERLLVTWPEFDPERDDVPRIDSKAPAAKEEFREMEIDSEELGALADTFLAAVRPDTTTGLRFGMFLRSAKMLGVSEWWEAQTTERLPPFAAKVDGAKPIADRDRSAAEVVPA